ncbi:MAG: hypothetical protein KTR26_05680 [Flammeovirgaceae bacterium]|nr:hypothetical protein [Flammeovirgaceae bacterium]
MNSKKLAKSVFLIITVFFTLSFSGENNSVCYKQNFKSKKALSDFEFSQPGKWLLSKKEKGFALEFTGKSEGYQPPFRSPHTVGLIKGKKFKNFTLDVDLRQTGKEYGHRDMCIFFGFQDPAHFYYVHIASITDDHANNIFIVDGAPRTKISTKTNEGNDWGKSEDWNHTRVVRDVESGKIEIYFKDMENPIMTATNTKFGEGAIGFGSFDDSGMIDNIQISGDGCIDSDNNFFPN